DDYSNPFFSGTKKTALIYTMNAPESMFSQIGYDATFKSYEMLLKAYFGSVVSMASTETLQVND
ncbi:MAG TPA: flavodoxin, partial [Coriobacteriia bacterium]|nr:flavodoxin [Coriobacteriia bacterium]